MIDSILAIKLYWCNMIHKLYKIFCCLIPLLLVADTCYAHIMVEPWQLPLVYLLYVALAVVLPILAQAVMLRLLVYTRFPVSVLHSVILHVVIKAVPDLSDLYWNPMFWSILIYTVNIILAVLSVHLVTKVPSNIIPPERIRPVAFTGARLWLDAAWKGILIALARSLAIYTYLGHV